MSLRTPQMSERYRQHLKNGGLENGCRLCERDPKHAFKQWKIIENHFPYDRIAATHDMLVPLRHVTEDDFSEEEKRELKEIKDGFVNENYEYLIEASHKDKTIPSHFHLHLISLKPELENHHEK